MIELDQLRQCRDLGDLPSEELGRVAERGHTLHKARGELVWRPGEPVREVYVMLRGVAHVQMSGPEGDLVLTGLVLPGHLIGEAEVFAGEPVRFNQVMAAEACSLLAVPAELFREQVQNNPDYALHWLGAANRKFVTSLRQIYSLKVGTAPVRLARTLLLIHHWQELDEGEDMALSQESIGQYAGLSRQVVNRILSDWRGRELVSTGYGYLRLLDLEALARIAETSS